jgi:TP901 family phage tail tape measure protein
MANPTITFNTTLNQAGALKDARTLRNSLGKPIDIKLNTRSLAQPLGRITGDVAEFTKSLQAATARVTAFGATSGGIIAVSQAISMVAKSVIEVDKQLIELNTFLGQSQSGLKSIGDSLFKVAKNTASSFADTAEAAKEFARQGLSVEETLKRTNDALVLSRISGLGAADSVNALTTAINSFNKSGLDSAEIVNKLVKVDSNFAVSAADLAQALTRVGSAAQDSGVGFEELIAVVTTAQQTTGRGGAIIGNALKTIFTRLKRPEVLDQLQELGVSVKDQNGALLSGTQILTNYISATKNLGQVEKARNDELLGGVYQINQLKAITNDLAKANGIYARSLQIANSATDDATKKNDELNKSLSAVIQNTKTNFEKRGGSIGEPIIKPLVKRIAGASNFLLDNLGVDKNSTDKDGKEIGNTFGQSFLKGVGEAVAGPGLVLIGVLALNIGKRLVSFVSDAAKVLLNINSVAGNTQAIEQAINNTLAQQPKITKAILSGQMTREQAASQLLRVFTLQNQQLMLQKGLSSSIAQSFSRSGYIASPEIGIYKRTPRKASGYIPSFAAEKREAMS